MKREIVAALIKKKLIVIVKHSWKTSCNGKSKIEKKLKKSFAPGLYDLTELQRDAQ